MIKFNEKKLFWVFDFFRYFSLFLVRTCIQAYKKIRKECPYGLKIWGSTNFNIGNPKKCLKFSYSYPPFFIKPES